MKKRIVIMSALSISLMGCQTMLEPKIEDSLPSVRPNEIAFYAKSESATKAFAEANETSLQSGWNCAALVNGTDVMFNTALTYESGVYRVSGKTYYYPANGTMDFYGCWPTSCEINSSTKTISYSQNPDTDLVVAKATGVAAQDVAVPMSFSHALSQVVVQCKAADANSDYKLKAIYLKAPQGGTYSFVTDEWSSLDAASEYTLFTNAGKALTTELQPAVNASTFLPGTVSLRVVWDCYNTGTSIVNGSYDREVSVTLTQGMKSTLNLTLPNEDAKEITLTVSVDGWSNESKDVNMGGVLISFEILGLGSGTYTALEGMTWGEFVESKYNTKGFIIYNEFVTNTNKNSQLSTYKDSNGEPTGQVVQYSTDIIQNGWMYMMEPGYLD